MFAAKFGKLNLKNGLVTNEENKWLQMTVVVNWIMQVKGHNATKKGLLQSNPRLCLKTKNTISLHKI